MATFPGGNPTSLDKVTVDSAGTPEKLTKNFPDLLPTPDTPEAVSGVGSRSGKFFVCLSGHERLHRGVFWTARMETPPLPPGVCSLRFIL